MSFTSNSNKKRRIMKEITEENEAEIHNLEYVNKTELDIINKCVDKLEIASNYYINDSFLESVKKLLNECKIDIKNRCIGCEIDLGSDNPRQYCCKTYCPDEKID